MHRALVIAGIVSLALIALANSSLVWTLIALVSFGLFVETIMKRGPKASDSDLDEIAVVGEASPDTEDGNHSFVPSLIVFVISLFFRRDARERSSRRYAIRSSLLAVNILGSGKSVCRQDGLRLRSGHFRRGMA